ncbi:MAG: hypothetical protein ACPGJS_00095 [Flammeovirgaceae bacterium]
MAKLKHIIKQLSEEDFRSIHDQLIDSNADKSAYLLKSMREKRISDAKIMEELEVNTNAYYTLRSRLNQKIEDYLLQQMESPRTDLLKKVANINETVFTKKRAITVATLKKLEKELKDYDLSNELTIVYKTLKKLHVNTEEHFSYSKLYNEHVAYMLAMDKAEDLLAEYFKKFGYYSLTGDEVDRLGLTLLQREVDNVCNLYQSHRLYIYQSCLNVFHRLFVDPEMSTEGQEPIEDILKKAQQIFDIYYLDAIYYHLQVVFEFLNLLYYDHFKVFRKAEEYYSSVNEKAGLLLSNFSLYTYPATLLHTKLERHLRLGTEGELFEENEALFDDFESDINDVPKHLNYVMYRAICCYYGGKFNEAAKWINNLLNDVSMRRFPNAVLEIKSILALQYCCMHDFDLFNQLVNSVQRQIRILGKENCEDIVIFIKMLKISISPAKRDKSNKIRALINKYKNIEQSRLFSPTRFIRMDDRFVDLLGDD